MVHNYPSISDNMVTWDQQNVIVAHDKDQVCPFLSCFVVALRHATKSLVRLGRFSSGLTMGQVRSGRFGSLRAGSGQVGLGRVGLGRFGLQVGSGRSG